MTLVAAKTPDRAVRRLLHHLPARLPIDVITTTTRTRAPRSCSTWP